MQDWIIQCNPKYYDIERAVRELETIDWRQMSQNIEEGSFVYIYVCDPKRCIKYKAEVLHVNKKDNFIDDSKYVISKEGLKENSSLSVMEIKIIKEFDDNKFPLSKLKENGLKTVQGWSRLCPELYNLLNE